MVGNTGKRVLTAVAFMTAFAVPTFAFSFGGNDGASSSAHYYEKFAPRMGPGNMEAIPAWRDKAPVEISEKRKSAVAEENRMRKSVSSEGIEKMRSLHEKMKNMGTKVTMSPRFRDYNPVLNQMENDMKLLVECLVKEGPIDCPPGYSKSGSGCHPGGVSGVIDYGGTFFVDPGSESYDIKTTFSTDGDGDGDSSSSSLGEGGQSSSQNTTINEETVATGDACPQKIDGTIVMVKYDTLDKGPVSCCLSEPYGQLDPTLCEYCMSNISFGTVDSEFDVDEYKKICCVNETFENLFPLCRDISLLTEETKEDEIQCKVTLGGFVIDMDDSIPHAQAAQKARQIIQGIEDVVNDLGGSSTVSLVSLGEDASLQIDKEELSKIVGAIRTYFKENGEGKGYVEKVKFVFDGSTYTYYPKDDAFKLEGEPMAFVIKTDAAETPEENATEEEGDVCKFGVALSRGMYRSGMVDVNKTKGALGRATFGNDFVIWFAGSIGAGKGVGGAPGTPIPEDIIKNCVGGVKLNTGVCCFTGNVVEDSSGNQYCMECNGKVVTGENGLQCVECPDGYMWDADKGICTKDPVNCLEVYNTEKPGYFDPSVLDSRFQGFPQTSGDCVKCENYAMTYKMEGDKIVCEPCPEGQYFDLFDKSCESCPSGKYLASVSYVYSDGGVHVDYECANNPSSSGSGSSSGGGPVTDNGGTETQTVQSDVGPAMGEAVLPSVFP